MSDTKQERKEQKSEFNQIVEEKKEDLTIINNTINSNNNNNNNASLGDSALQTQIQNATKQITRSKHQTANQKQRDGINKKLPQKM